MLAQPEIHHVRRSSLQIGEEYTSVDIVPQVLRCPNTHRMLKLDTRLSAEKEVPRIALGEWRKRAIEACLMRARSSQRIGRGDPQLLGVSDVIREGIPVLDLTRNEHIHRTSLIFNHRPR